MKRVATCNLAPFVWAGRTGYFVSIYDKSAGFDDDLFPRRELARYRFPVPADVVSGPELDRVYRAASNCAHGIESTLKRRPGLIRRRLGLDG